MQFPWNCVSAVHTPQYVRISLVVSDGRPCLLALNVCNFLLKQNKPQTLFYISFVVTRVIFSILSQLDIIPVIICTWSCI